MIIIAGHTLVDADARDGVVSTHQDLVARARKSGGCLEVAISADPIDPRRINIIEVWRDADALESWRAVANAPEMGTDIIENNVQRYKAEDGGPLF